MPPLRCCCCPQLRGIIERLGPAYVKVAQAISTRVDLLTPEYFLQIQLLQDRVPPFPCEQVCVKLKFRTCVMGSEAGTAGGSSGHRHGSDANWL